MHAHLLIIGGFRIIDAIGKREASCYGSFERPGRIRNRISIDKRPAIVDKRNRIADWEGDTVIGNGRQSPLVDKGERKRRTMITKTDR